MTFFFKDKAPFISLTDTFATDKCTFGPILSTPAFPFKEFKGHVYLCQFHYFRYLQSPSLVVTEVEVKRVQLVQTHHLHQRHDVAHREEVPGHVQH